MSTSVFVTGATGFIAQHIIKLLLSKGYSVVGTVRSSEKGENLNNLFDSEAFSYEVVPSLVTPGAFDKALQNHPEVTVFLHTASPVVFNVTSIEEELLTPAVEGTKNAFSAIQNYGANVKHVVVTSSVAANIDPSRSKDPAYIISEDTWSPLTWEQSQANAILGYFGSKRFAEKAAWDFHEREKPAFTLNTVNPVYVFGPQAFDAEVKDQLNASMEVVNQLLKLEPDSDIPANSGGFVDVRDVAKAHLAAFEDGFSGKRLLLRTEAFTSQDLLDILNNNFDSLKGKLPIGTPGQGKELAGPSAGLDNEKTKKLLGFSFIDLEKSVVDSVSQILRARKSE